MNYTNTTINFFDLYAESIVIGMNVFVAVLFLIVLCMRKTFDIARRQVTHV